MSHDTRVRILIASIAMGITTLLGVPAVQSGSLPAWAFGLCLAGEAILGLLSPEIERAWAKSRFWLSDHYWSNR